MFGFIGIIITVFMVFGGYVIAGGNLGPILASLPFELMIIGGAAVGAYILSNSTSVLKETFGGLKRAFAGPRWVADDHADVLCLLYQLLRLARTSPVDLEAH